MVRQRNKKAATSSLRSQVAASSTGCRTKECRRGALARILVCNQGGSFALAALGSAGATSGCSSNAGGPGRSLGAAARGSVRRDCRPRRPHCNRPHNQGRKCCRDIHPSPGASRRASSRRSYSRPSTQTNRSSCCSSSRTHCRSRDLEQTHAAAAIHPAAQQP